MFAELSKRFSFLINKLPIGIRSFVSLLANFIDEIYVITNFKLREGWCFIDIGANVGAYSILASKIVGKNGVVIAVEPDPCNFKALLFLANLVRNVIPIKVAMWNENEYRKLYRPSCSAFSSLVQVENPMNFTEVICVTLDLLYEKIVKGFIDHVDAVKIDVEGAEVEVLEGSKKVLNMVKFILIEYHSDRMRKKIIALLDKYEFRIKTIGSYHIIGVKNSEYI